MLTRCGEYAEHFDADYPDQRLGALCREAGIPLLVMTKDFREAAPSRSTKATDQWLFHQGTGHFNERGNQLAARAVHRFLTRRGPHLLSDRPFVRQLR
jgi:hypothetical protein